MDINKWTNKQIWRITKLYQIFQPMINIVQLLLWGVIAIGVNAWFELSFEVFIIITVTIMVALNIIGWVADVKGFIKEHKVREFIIQFPELYKNQAVLGSALIAKFMKMPMSEIDKAINEAATYLGMEGLDFEV